MMTTQEICHVDRCLNGCTSETGCARGKGLLAPGGDVEALRSEQVRLRRELWAVEDQLQVIERAKWDKMRAEREAWVAANPGQQPSLLRTFGRACSVCYGSGRAPGGGICNCLSTAQPTCVTR